MTMAYSTINRVSAKDIVQIAALLLDETIARCALNEAVIEGQLPVVKLIRKLLSKNDYPDENGFTSVNYAAQAGQYDIVKFLVEEMKDSDKKCTLRERWTNLHLSCKAGCMQLCEYFVKKRGNDVNCTDFSGYTPLHYACYKGSWEVVYYLIKNGANPFIESTDEKKVNPIDIVKLRGDQDIINLMKTLNEDAKKQKKFITAATKKTITSRIYEIAGSNGSNIAVLTDHFVLRRVPSKIFDIYQRLDDVRNTQASQLSRPYLPCPSENNQTTSAEKFQPTDMHADEITEKETYEIFMECETEVKGLACSIPGNNNTMYYQSRKSVSDRSSNVRQSPDGLAGNDNKEQLNLVTRSTQYSDQNSPENIYETNDCYQMYGGKTPDNTYYDLAQMTLVKQYSFNRPNDYVAGKKFNMCNHTSQQTVTDGSSRTRQFRRSASEKKSIMRNEQTAVKTVYDDVSEESRHILEQQHATNDDLQSREAPAVPSIFEEYICKEVVLKELAQAKEKAKNLIATSEDMMEIVIDKQNIAQEVLNIYSKIDDITYKIPRISYKEQKDGATESKDIMKEIFTLFWAEIFRTNFHGENAKVPNEVDDGILGQGALHNWKALGKILSHYMALYGFIPVKFCRSALYHVVSNSNTSEVISDSNIPDEVLLNDFLLFVNEEEKCLLIKALTSAHLSSEDKKALASLFHQYDAHINLETMPLDRKKQIIDIARNELLIKPGCFYILIRDGIPTRYQRDLWQSVKMPHLTQMYKCLTPSPKAVATRIRAVASDGVVVPFEQEKEILTKHQCDKIYFLRQTVQSLSSDMLARFLLSATGTDLMSEDIIKVIFKEFVQGTNSPQSQVFKI